MPDSHTPFPRPFPIPPMLYFCPLSHQPASLLSFRSQIFQSLLPSGLSPQPSISTPPSLFIPSSPPILAPSSPPPSKTPIPLSFVPLFSPTRQPPPIQTTANLPTPSALSLSFPPIFTPY